MIVSESQTSRRRRRRLRGTVRIIVSIESLRKGRLLSNSMKKSKMFIGEKEYRIAL